MSWHFSQALEAEYLAACCSGGEPCAPWSETPTAPDDSCSDKMKGTFHRSPFGMMFAPSTEHRGAELLTWFRAAFRARTLVPQEQGAVFLGDVPGFGMKCLGLLARYDRDSCSWKTPRASLLGDSIEFSETWPAWGLMRGGELLALQTPEGFTPGNVCGLWLTPTVEDFKRRGTATAWEEYKTTKRETCARLRNQVQPEHGEGYLTPEFAESLMWWPIGWSAAQPLATDRFQQWQRWHGVF